MTAAATTPSHAWIGSLQAELDALEAALLRGDAPGVERASAAMQTVLQQAPRSAAFSDPESALRRDTQTAAQRFAQLRQAVLRASAQSERAVASLLPQQAMQRQPTYGRIAKPSSLGGAGRGFLSA
ncbi:hypothetical protein [Hydrogenophaga sp.]|jgi:hypothetical protein|uniref:hypothetical protein n=1 Tax=Hydrogenophaga sp. TaxID=1904254 RepID=UPI003F7010C8